PRSPAGEDHHAIRGLGAKPCPMLARALPALLIPLLLSAVVGGGQSKSCDKLKRIARLRRRCRVCLPHQTCPMWQSPAALLQPRPEASGLQSSELYGSLAVRERQLLPSSAG